MRYDYTYSIIHTIRFEFDTMSAFTTEAQKSGVEGSDSRPSKYVYIPKDLNEVLFIGDFRIIDIGGIRLSKSSTEVGKFDCVCLTYPDWKGNHILISVATYGSMLVEWKDPKGCIEHRFFNQNTGSYIYGLLWDLFDTMKG